MMCLFALGIFYRICSIQFIHGKEWTEKAEKLTTGLFNIEAGRGNIFDVNGALLATSLPYYEVGMDICAPSIDDKLFKEKRDSLAQCLSDFFKDKSKKDYIKLLNKARAEMEKPADERNHYVVLQRNVPYKDLQVIKKFPIFKKGKRGGLVTFQTNRRERPFQWLAARTIGMSREGINPVGLEGAFDTTLKGTGGKQLMQRIAGDVWRPVNADPEVEPKDGSDLYTTIDINIQDVAEQALMKALIKNNASHGCAVLMEVKTGAIKAIANLSRDRKDSLTYVEDYNYAVGYSAEPGSTFKLASMLALMDDFGVSPEEKVSVGNGTAMFSDLEMKDSHTPEAPVLSAQRIFEISSNVGVAKLVTKYYSKNPQQFIDKLNSFHLNTKLGITLPGEGVPRIKQTKDADWWATSLPWISHGYESMITPLQTLTLYNAVANNGTMVKPLFVKEIRRNGIVTRKFETEVLNEKIVKQETIDKAKKMMEGVVKNGTGKALNVKAFQVAGKTGTAKISRNGKYEKTYQASFVGYFPAEKPLYTCIVIINSPSNGIYYGGLVAGPVFKEIAEKVYSNNVNFIEPVNNHRDFITKAPAVITTKGNEVEELAKTFALPSSTNNTENYVAQNTKDSTRITVYENPIEQQLKKGIMPNLTGLSAKDALYILENHGLYVRVLGFGSVRKQSIEAGQKIARGHKVTLTLS
jgi:cell division protein FtsI (penicillin-binding protein 3)